MYCVFVTPIILDVIYTIRDYREDKKTTDNKDYNNNNNNNWNFNRNKNKLKEVIYNQYEVMEETQRQFNSLSMNPTKDYKLITEHYNNYHEQNVCSSCKYYRMRWIDNVCEKHHCVVSAIGICDKFIKNL